MSTGCCATAKNQSDILTKNCFEKYLGKLVMNLFNKHRLFAGKTSCYNGTGFIDDIFLVKLVYSYTSDIINAGSPPSCRETLTIGSNFLLSRIDQRVSSKNGGTSTGNPVAEANLMTCIERLQYDDLKSSQLRRTGVHPIFMYRGVHRQYYFLYSVLCLGCRFRLQLMTIHCNRRGV